MEITDDNVFVYLECEYCTGLFPVDAIELHIKVGHEPETSRDSLLNRLVPIRRAFAVTHLPNYNGPNGHQHHTPKPVNMNKRKLNSDANWLQKQPDASPSVDYDDDDAISVKQEIDESRSESGSPQSSDNDSDHEWTPGTKRTKIRKNRGSEDRKTRPTDSTEAGTDTTGNYGVAVFAKGQHSLKNDLLLYSSRLHPGRVYEFSRDRIKYGSTYYKCRNCELVKRSLIKQQQPATFSVPRCRVSPEGIVVSNPEEPQHVCNGSDTNYELNIVDDEANGDMSVTYFTKAGIGNYGTAVYCKGTHSIKHDLLLYNSRLHPGRVYEFVQDSIRNGRTSFKCRNCDQIKRTLRQQQRPATFSVPRCHVSQEGVIVTDPETPAHVCNGSDRNYDADNVDDGDESDPDVMHTLTPENYGVAVIVKWNDSHSKEGTLRYKSRRHPGRYYDFRKSKEQGNRTYYICRECSNQKIRLKKANELADFSVPTCCVSNGVVVNDPECPNKNPHVCKGYELASVPEPVDKSKINYGPPQFVDDGDGKHRNQVFHYKSRLHPGRVYKFRLWKKKLGVCQYDYYMCWPCKSIKRKQQLVDFKIPLCRVSDGLIVTDPEKHRHMCDGIDQVDQEDDEKADCVTSEMPDCQGEVIVEKVT